MPEVPPVITITLLLRPRMTLQMPPLKYNFNAISITTMLNPKTAFLFSWRKYSNVLSNSYILKIYI